MKRIAVLLLMTLSLSICAACGGEGNDEKFVDHMTADGTGIARQAEPAADAGKYRAKEYITLNEDQADIRWYDCGNLKKDELKVLKSCIPDVTFNEATRFTDDILSVFPAPAILENGKNPGLGVKSLHEQGITGKGVGIAIIDQILYTGHPEYAPQLALYEEMHVSSGNPEGSMHGAAVSSIAVGANCGVAPEAKLYYWGFDNVVSWKDEDLKVAWEEYARVIDRVIEVNQKLPDDEKIRVISISRGYGFTGDAEEDAKIQTMLDAIVRASDEGIFVITTSTELNYDFFSEFNTNAPFAGLGKTDPSGDPDSVDTYTLGAWQWENAEFFENSLLFPMDDRTTADMSGDTYVFYADGGWSWVVPYVAGVYALCAQTDPAITPEKFYRAAMETSTEITRSREEGGTSHTFHVINPTALVRSLQSPG